jgi:hypothetical protein
VRSHARVTESRLKPRDYGQSKKALPAVCILPGHGCVSQATVSTSPVTLGQLLPPSTAGVVTMYVLVMVPGPHVAEHSV